MSEDKTLQLPTTDEYPSPNQTSSSSGGDPKLGGWYLVALFFGVITLAGGGFLMGQRLENQALTETLEAVTESVAEIESTALMESQATGTAIIQNYTATPTITDAPTLTATPEIPEGIILPIQVELREYPGENAPVIEIIPQDTLVMVLSTTSDNLWLEVNFYTKNSAIETGFIPAETIFINGGDLSVLAVASYPSETPTNTPFPTPVPSQTALPTPTPVIPVAEVAGVSVLVYDIPATDAVIITVLNQASEVEIIGVSPDNKWYEISYLDADEEAQAGFVNQTDLVVRGGSLQAVPIAALPTPTDIPATDTPIPTPTAPQVVSQGMLMLVRSGPAEVFDPIGFVDNETSLTINAISPDGQWLQVDFPESPTGLGWIATTNIQISGSLQYLPIVQGAIPPTPEIEVVIEGEIIVPPVAGNPTPSNSTNSTNAPTVSDLPRNFNFEFVDLPEIDIYAFNIGVVIVGNDNDGAYQTSVEIGIAEDKTRNKFKFEVAAQGDYVSDFEDLGDLLPVAVGTIDDEVYIYFGEEDACFPSDETISIDEALEAFAPFAFSSEQLVREVGILSVFGIIDDNTLYGVPVVHYQFLGYRDGSTVLGYEPTDDMKIDLWFNADETVLYSFSFIFNITEGSEFSEAFIDAFGFEGIDLEGFEGQVRFFALPKGFGEDASIYSDPPAACDLFLD